MKSRKRSCIAAVMSILFFSVACGIIFAAPMKKEYTIGLYCHHIIPPWLTLQNSARLRAEEISKQYGVNIRLDIQYPSLVTDIARQMKIIDDYVAKKVDMIVAIPITTSSFDVVVKKANDAKIPIGAFITSQDPPPGGHIEWWLYNDDRVGGYNLGKDIIQKMGGQGNLVLLQGVYECIWNQNRAKGVYDAVKEFPDVKMLVDDTANWARIDATKLMEDVITRYGKTINGVIALNDEMAIGAKIALDEAGIKVPIGGWDGTYFSCQYIMDGSLDSSVDMHWASMGVQLMDLAWQTLQGKKVKPERNILMTTLIDKPYATKLLKEISDAESNNKPDDWKLMTLTNYRKVVLHLKPGDFSE